MLKDTTSSPFFWGALLCVGSLLPSQVNGAEWLKGDLHAHSLHSDGDSPVADILSLAESRGLDFFALTDHDISMGGDTPHWRDPDYQSDLMILLYGVEWTTGEGHANVWAAAPFDYQDMWAANLAGDPQLAAQVAHAEGALFSLNHPTAFNCCAWEGATDGIDAIEVWNGTHRAPTFDNVATRDVWLNVLADGRMVTAVGGSDTHDLYWPLGALYSIGEPTTWVLSEAATPAGILAGIESGAVAISYGPQGPRAEISADGNGDGIFETVMGATLSPGNHTFKISLHVPDSEEVGDMKTASLKETASFFEGTASPSALLNFGSVLGEGSCGPGYLVGLFEGKRLRRVYQVGCEGGEATVDLNTKPGQLWRLEVLGIPKVDPIKQPVFGVYLALSNPIYVVD